MDVYLWNEKRLFLARIDSLDGLENALIILKEKTGVIIDEYGDSKIYLEHVQILDEYIDSNSAWKEVLQSALENQCGLIVIGD
jgi:hypothetical protein